MNITYNNVDEPQNMVTFTEVPNILSIQDDSSGTKATITLVFDGNLRQTVTAESQYYITILGETISSTMDSEKNQNKRFYVSGDEDSTAMNVCRALRCCGGLAADFNIIHGGNYVSIVAKTIGSKGLNVPGAVQRNIPNDKLTVEVSDGTSQSDTFNSKIDIDVYSGTSADEVQNYVTTLEKNFYGNECAFNMSPILATLSDYGKTQYYELAMHLIREDGEWQYLGNVNGYTTIGYHANQSDKYKYAEGVQVLINKNRGQDGTMTLYTYGNIIPLSLLCNPDRFGWDVSYNILDSAFNVIDSGSTIGRRIGGNNLIVDTNVTIDEEAFAAGYYIDITFDNAYTIRFNIIKPLKATEYYQRILWRNEYGGVSFFDFTGARSETDNVDIETYEKNVFDYYTSNVFEKKKIYDNKYTKSVTLTSHLMEEDGKWIFNSLMRSKKVWTEVNGKTYYIIPTAISVTEDNQYNNIYVAKLTYEYSDI